MAASDLVICDFDGTVTAIDTNSYLARRFAPGADAALEGKLATREASLREVLETQHGAMRQGDEAIVGAALEVPLREGFADFVARTRAAGQRLVILSSGFRQLIAPMLERAGLGDLELVSNELEMTGEGGRITWRDLPRCDACGEPCKRHDVARLRQAGGHARVTFIGDGFSDRCGAEEADEIWAVAGGALEEDLRARGRAHSAFESFDEVRLA